MKRVCFKIWVETFPGKTGQNDKEMETGEGKEKRVQSRRPNV